MIHEWKTSAAQYAFSYQGKEDVFYINADGSGVCVALHDAWKNIAPPNKDKMGALLETMLSQIKHDRAASIKEEFSCEVQLPDETTRLLWRAWTLAGDIDASPKVREELDQLGEWLDKELQPFLELNFPEETNDR